MGYPKRGPGRRRVVNRRRLVLGVAGSPVNVDAVTATVSVAAQVPAVSSGVTVSPPVAAVTISAPAPTVSAGVAVSPPVASVTVAAPAPTVSSGVTVAPPAATITVTALAPAISGAILVAPPAAVITVLALAPSVAAGAVLAPPVVAVQVQAWPPGGVNRSRRAGHVVGVPVCTTVGGGAALMRFTREDLKELWVTVTTNVDPASATVVLELDGATEYACTWDAAATQVATGRWTRTAHTDVTFYGPDVAAGEIGSATALTAGAHSVEVLLRIGGRIISAGVPGFTVR